MRLIDADAFKEYICNALEQTRQCYPDGGRWAEAITEQFCLDIDEQPTVNPEPHWIPVTERLPERSGDYLVTRDSIEVYEPEAYVTIDYFEADTLDWDGYGNLVTAWMPLPEPYKGVAE